MGTLRMDEPRRCRINYSFRNGTRFGLSRAAERNLLGRVRPEHVGVEQASPSRIGICTSFSTTSFQSRGWETLVDLGRAAPFGGHGILVMGCGYELWVVCARAVLPRSRSAWCSAARWPAVHTRRQFDKFLRGRWSRRSGKAITEGGITLN